MMGKHSNTGHKSNENFQLSKDQSVHFTITIIISILTDKMKNQFLATFFALFMLVPAPEMSAQSHVAFKHPTTKVSKSPINHALTNNNPNALVFITLNGTNGVNYDRATGVKFENGSWYVTSVFEQLPFPDKTVFNVLAFRDEQACAFRHTAATNGKNTVLDHPQLNGNGAAKLIVTQNLTNGVINAKNIGVKYANNKWAIFNEDGSDIPKNAMFNVLIAGNGFTHGVDKSNIHPNWTSTTVMNHASVNNREQALVFLTHQYKEKALDAPLAVWWENSRWTAYVLSSKIETGETLNVYVYTESAPCDAPANLTGKWIGVKNGQIPRGAFQGGTESTGAPLYIIRAKHEGGLHVGKARKGDNYALIGYGGAEIQKTAYEAYTGIGLWVKASKSLFPANAIRGGEEANGEPIYIARAKFGGNYHIGKVKRNMEAFIPYGGKENISSSYEVLVSKLEAGNIVTGGECYLQNSINNLCIEPSTYTKKSADLSLMPYDNEEIFQRWVLEAANADGTQFRVVNKFTKQFLRAKVLSTSITAGSGSSTSYWVYQNELSFQWPIRFNPDGTFMLNWSGSYLTPTGNIYGEGVMLAGNAQAPECRWNPLPSNAFSSYVAPSVISTSSSYNAIVSQGSPRLQDGLVSGKSYSILLPNKKKNLDAWLKDVEKDGCPVDIWDYAVEGGVHTHWVLERVKNTDVFVIYNAASRKALSIKNLAGAVELRDFTKTSWQFWKIQPSDLTGSSKKYVIYPLRDFGGKGLMVNGNRDINGTLVQLGQPAQEWIFEENPSLSASCVNKADEYLSGDWDGDGKTDLAIRIDSRILYDYGNNDVMDNEQFYGFGNAEDQYLVGDWDGDGADNIAVRRGSQFFFDTNFDGGHELSQHFYGSERVPGEQYLVGDWNGDGKDNIALRQNNTILFDYNFDPTVDYKFSFGFGDLTEGEYLTGDWNGDGKDNIAFRFRNEISYDFNYTAGVDLKQTFGWAEDQFLVGDWDGNGVDNIATRFNGVIEMDTDFDKEREKETTIGCGISAPLKGWVDMHTHPASQDAFGGEYFYGWNDGNPAASLGECICYHDYPPDIVIDIDTPFGKIKQEIPVPDDRGCRNRIRKDFVQKADPHEHWQGYPDFLSWPTHKSILHQQMWWEWIDRARKGGQRVMVALAHNSHALADASESNRTPADDMGSMNVQIKNMIDFICRHKDIMDTVTTSKRLREVVTSGRLAMVIGVEMDNIGNFYSPADGKGASYKPNPSWPEIKSEIDRIWNLGVRYIFPIHITNNIFGGAALYGKGFEGVVFNISNNYNNQSVYRPMETNETGWKMFNVNDNLDVIVELQKIFDKCNNDLVPDFLPCRLLHPTQYRYDGPMEKKGHQNSIGLIGHGPDAIKYLMQKGFLIDIDHMSDLAANQTLSIAESYKYPVNSGHAGPRHDCSGDNKCGSERDRTDEQYKKIIELGGMLGLGHGDNAAGFAGTMAYVGQVAGYKNLAIGTDVNIVALPGPPTTPSGKLSQELPIGPIKTGNKTWDYKTYNADGVSHYGMLPEFFESASQSGWDSRAKNAFYMGAEYFAQMWEKCERQKSKVP